MNLFRVQLLRFARFYNDLVPARTIHIIRVGNNTNNNIPKPFVQYTTPMKYYLRRHIISDNILFRTELTSGVCVYHRDR